MEPDPKQSSDKTLTEVVHDLDQRGFDGQFRAEEGGQICCLTCHEAFAAATGHADHVVRLEGESDPADMAIVIPLRCPSCGTGGTLVAQYGPDTTTEESEVLLALERVPREGSDT